MMLALAVGFLCLLAIFDLFVGVSNDAVNFLNSAIGSRVASFKTVLFVASCGILLGALMSSGMMDIARHGVMHPSYFTLMEVMTIFMAVMAADIFVLDCFNNWGMPTSTTVSLVFELLGATVSISLIKIYYDPSLNFAMLCNSDKALSMIIAIFVSVAIAFVAGSIVQWLARLTFSFRIKQSSKLLKSTFGFISFSILSFFVLIKGVGGSPLLPEVAKNLMNEHIEYVVMAIAVLSLIASVLFIVKKIDPFKPTILYGTFALAMAFASNDLVNFIGIPMAGIDSFTTWIATGSDPSTFAMTTLEASANTSVEYLFVAAVIMIVAMATSKKARHVVETSVNLSRQDESDEMFGSSKAARSIVAVAQKQIDWIASHTPLPIQRAVNRRFAAVPLNNDAAFDEVRAAVNLVLASCLIVVGTLWKLPLSTTYVTFMVAMGTSLADRAWGRESAVFRITGMLSVVGGWLLTAAMAFITAAAFCIVLFYGGFAAMIAAIAAVVVLLIRSRRKFNDKQQISGIEGVEQLMLRCHNGELVEELLHKYVRDRQSFMVKTTIERYQLIVGGLKTYQTKGMRKVLQEISESRHLLKKYRKSAFLALKLTPQTFAIEKSTWFHLGFNADEQWLYCLKRMAEPTIEHIGNGFNPLPESYAADYEPTYREVVDMLKQSAEMIDTGSYEEYHELMQKADSIKERMAIMRRQLVNKMHTDESTKDYNISLVYLNLLQETQELLSIMRHQLRATRKFLS